jgi:hypothetical protein
MYFCSVLGLYDGYFWVLWLYFVNVLDFENNLIFINNWIIKITSFITVSKGIDW